MIRDEYFTKPEDYFGKFVNYDAGDKVLVFDKDRPYEIPEKHAVSERLDKDDKTGVIECRLYISSSNFRASFHLSSPESNSLPKDRNDLWEKSLHCFRAFAK